MKPERPDTPTELKVRALRYLVRRDHSRAELARKLAPYAASAESLDAVLDELHAKKQLSDERYAEARANWLSRKYGAAKIRQDLKAHGVAAALVERVSSAGGLGKGRALPARKNPAPPPTPPGEGRRARLFPGGGVSFSVGGNPLRTED